MVVGVVVGAVVGVVVVAGPTNVVALTTEDELVERNSPLEAGNRTAGATVGVVARDPAVVVVVGAETVDGVVPLELGRRGRAAALGGKFGRPSVSGAPSSDVVVGTPA